MSPNVIANISLALMIAAGALIIVAVNARSQEQRDIQSYSEKCKAAGGVAVRFNAAIGCVQKSIFVEVK